MTTKLYSKKLMKITGGVPGAIVAVNAVACHLHYPINEVLDMFLAKSERKSDIWAMYKDKFKKCASEYAIYLKDT
jgi:hypothetical protein